MRNIKPGSVVVGVDGTPHSDAAVTWAVSYAALFNRPLLLVGVTGKPGVKEELQPDGRRDRRVLARRAADQGLRLAARTAPGLDTGTLVLNGDPRTVLVDLSAQSALVVVGTRGHGPVGSALLGSVSVAVAAHARCPVAVVRPRGQRMRGVVVGVSADGSDDAALRFAAELASAEGSDLSAVHAWQPLDAMVDPASHAHRVEHAERRARAMVEALGGLAEKYPDVAITRDMPELAPVRALTERSESAETLVLGRRRRPPFAGFGSVSRGVVERAHNTVVIVPGNAP